MSQSLQISISGKESKRKLSCLDQMYHLLFCDSTGLGLMNEFRHQINDQGLEYLAFLALENIDELPFRFDCFTVEVFDMCAISEGSYLDKLLEMNSVFWRDWKKASVYIFGSDQFVAKLSWYLPYYLNAPTIVVTTTFNEGSR